MIFFRSGDVIEIDKEDIDKMIEFSMAMIVGEGCEGNHDRYMAKAREIAQEWSRHEGLSCGLCYIPTVSIKTLAGGFLALDRQPRCYPPSEKPEKYHSVLIKINEEAFHAGYQVGCWNHDEIWTACDSTYTTDDIDHWQHLPTAVKR